MAFINHPDRAAILGEIHLRRMPSITAPAIMLQVLRVVDQADRADEPAFFERLPFEPLTTVQSDRHGEATFERGLQFWWEQHSEATTIAALLPFDPNDAQVPASIERAVTGWLAEAPGSVLRATRISIIENDKTGKLPQADSSDAKDVVSVETANGARFWTDFSVRDNGFGWLVVATRGIAAGDVGRAIQRFQEIGNYRNLALLGQRLVRDETAVLRRIEDKLARLSAGLESVPNVEQHLNSISSLADELATLEARTAFRLSATEAYAAIVMQRLDALQARPIPGYQSLEDFTERRLLPAVATCRNFTDRIARASLQIERLSTRLRTRVEMTIQQQNQSMLLSIRDNAARQLQLQELVEGLSVIAVAYYALGLISYGLKGLGHTVPAVQPDVTIAIISLPVLFLSWLFLRRRLHRTVNQNREAGSGRGGPE